MSVLRPRNRLVNFRLAEDEFESLKSACTVQGARSVSDFARSAVLERIGEPGPRAFSQSRVELLDNKVCELELRVDQLLNLMHATGQSVPGASTVETPPLELRAEAARIP